jgi:hypothetical protein
VSSTKFIREAGQVLIIQEIPANTRQLATLDNHSELVDIHQRRLEGNTPIGNMLEILTFSQSMGLHSTASEQTTKLPTKNVIM